MTSDRSDDQSSPAAALRAAAVAIHAEVTPHPHFKCARSELERVLSCSPMALFLGSARTGKTRLIETMASQMRRPPDGAPQHYAAVIVQAPAPHRGAFSWKMLWKRCLDELDEPLLDYKVDRRGMLRGLSRGVRPRSGRDNAEALFDSVCGAARDRALRVLFIDEAAEFIKSGHGRVLRDQLDVLRSLADLASFQIVLVSTSRLLHGLDASGELLGRTEEVFMRRYSAQGPDRRSHQRGFARIVNRFMALVPESARFEPSHAQYLALNAGTHGCIGHLSKWFRRAIEYCVSLGDDRLEWRHFEQTGLSRKKYAQLATQVARDDEVMLEWSTPAVRVEPSASPAAAPPASDPEPKPPAPGSKPAPRRPGVQRPTRRKVA